MKKRSLIICVAALDFLCSKAALKAAAAETTPWQTYLDKAPAQAEQFAADPLGTLLRLFAAEPVQLLREVLHQYAGVLLFLSLAAGLAFLLQDTADKALLELAVAGGCGVLLWQELDKLASLYYSHCSVKDILKYLSDLTSLSVILTGQHGDWLLIPYALMCIRQAGIILILPKLLKRYPCIKPKDKKEKHE